MIAVKLVANQWGGADVVGGNGVARWTKDDGRRRVFFLEGLTAQALAWQVAIDDEAPPAIFQAAWAQALAAAGPVPGPLPPTSLRHYRSPA